MPGLSSPPGRPVRCWRELVLDGIAQEAPLRAGGPVLIASCRGKLPISNRLQPAQTTPKDLCLDRRAHPRWHRKKPYIHAYIYHISQTHNITPGIRSDNSTTFFHRYEENWARYPPLSWPSRAGTGRRSSATTPAGRSCGYRRWASASACTAG